MTSNEPKNVILSSGVFLGYYQILSHLISGNTGEFWLALKPGGQEGKIFVAKTLQARLDMDQSFVERFWHHAMEASRLDHPNIVRLLDGGAAQGIQYVVMEYVPGRSLEHILWKQQIPPLWFVIKVACQICEALLHAHSLKDESNSSSMIHGCLVPKKVMISCNGTVKVLGFGISQVASMIQDIASKVRLLRFAYLSPEHLRGVALDHRCDLYGLGVLMYELLTGTRPYSGKSVFHLIQRISEGNPRPITQINPAIPADLEAIVMKAMHHRVEKRYNTAAEFKEDLLEVFSSLSSRSVTNELTHYLRDLFPEIPWSERCDESSEVSSRQAPNDTNVEHITFTGQNLFLESLSREIPTTERNIIITNNLLEKAEKEGITIARDILVSNEAIPPKLKREKNKKSIFDIASEQRDGEKLASGNKAKKQVEGYDPFQKTTKSSSDVFSIGNTPPSDEIPQGREEPTSENVDIFSVYGAKRSADPITKSMDEPSLRSQSQTDIFAMYKRTSPAIEEETPKIQKESRQNPFIPAPVNSAKQAFGRNDSVSHFEQGLGAYRSGNYNEALREWERAIELEPDNRKYRSNLTRLKTMMAEKMPEKK